MRKNLKLILIYVLLLLPLSATNIYAQFTKTSQGIIVTISGKKVELAVAKSAAFRISMKYSGTPTPISSIIIDNSNQTISDFTVVSEAPVYGIQTSYGKLLVNTTTRKWMFYNAAGDPLIENGTFTSNSTLQTINDGDKAAGDLYGSGNYGSKKLIKTRSNSYQGNGSAGIPYFWNTVGYCAMGVTADDNNPAQWTKIGNASIWQFTGTTADLYIWPAKTHYEALKGMAQLVGKSTVPPKWAFGFMQSRWGWVDKTYVEDAMNKFRTRKLPVDAFIYDFEWYTENPDYSTEGQPYYIDFGFNPKLFNEPATQIAAYNSNGIKQLGIRKPRLGNSANLEYARSRGWLKNPNSGNFESRNLDYSIEAARNWYIEQMRPLLKTGINGWWNDEGEAYYSLYYWWNKAEDDLLKSEKPNTRNFSLNRSFSLGVQRFGFCTWTGDIKSDWATMLGTPAEILNYSLAGMTYGSCDIGGFDGTPTPEGMVRWYQLGAFLPIMRSHSALYDTPRFPWLYGASAESAIKKALNLRYQLIPYIYSLGHEAFNTGAPIMRPLIMEFPKDTSVVNMTDEWLLGYGLLAAPVMNGGGSRTVYLPKDIWYDFSKNTAIQGPSTFTVSAALDEIPIYVRAGAILPIGPVVQNIEQDTISPLELRIYPGHDGSFTMTEDDGKSNDYTRDMNVRKTVYTWNDETKTLSWNVNGTYTDSHVYTTIKAIVGSEVQSATLGSEGSLVFKGFQLPVFSPEPGTYENPPMISINAPAEAVVYYTLDGSTPTKNSTVYSEPFKVPERMIVTVKAFMALNGTDYPVTSANYSIISCRGEGSISMEKWTGLDSSVGISSIPVNQTPNKISYLTDQLEVPANSDLNYGVRVLGYLKAPESGNYTFYIAGDDNVQLRLGTNSDLSSLTRIAYIDGNGWTNSREWNKYPSQKSKTIALTKCQSYPIETLLKQSAGGVNMAVRWITPSGVDEVISCKWLSTLESDACTVNLSLQKAATASGELADNQAAINAVDGDNSTKWCSYVSGSGWLEVDLGSDMKICRWHVLHAGSEQSNYITNDFKLQKKVGANWVDVDVVTGNLENETDRCVTPFTARYVRLYITKPELNSAIGSARIFDFSVFGSTNSPNTDLQVVDNENGINLFPSPSQIIVNLEVLNPELKVDKVDVIDLKGIMVKSFAINSNKQTLDISNIKAGVYFFRIHTSKDATMIRKMIKL